MGQLTVIMGGLDDVVIDDVDINNVDVAGKRRRICWLELQSSPQRRWWQASGGELEERQRRRRGSNAKHDMRDKERRRWGERGGNSTNSRCKGDGGATREEAMQQPTSTREVQCKERDRRWRDKRGEGWYGKVLHGQHNKKRCSMTASNLN